MMQIQRIKHEVALTKVTEHICRKWGQQLWDWVQQFTEPFFCL